MASPGSRHEQLISLDSRLSEQDRLLMHTLPVLDDAELLVVGHIILQPVPSDKDFLMGSAREAR